MGTYEDRMDDYRREEAEDRFERRYGLTPDTRCPTCGSDELMPVDYIYGGEYPNNERRRGFECEHCGTEVSSAVA